MFDLDFIHHLTWDLLSRSFWSSSLATRIRQAPPDPRIHHIPACAHAKSAHRTGRHQNPLFEQLDKLYLGQITVDIKTDEDIPNPTISSMLWVMR